jgi:hypothetical protein
MALRDICSIPEIVDKVCEPVEQYEVYWVVQVLNFCPVKRCISSQLLYTLFLIMSSPFLADGLHVQIVCTQQKTTFLHSSSNSLK